MFEPPVKVAFLMREFQPDWFVAGGWAIDLFLGKETRPHEDIEFAIFRRDQFELQNYLQGWSLRKVVNGELSEWKKEEFLELPVHEIHCFSETAEPYRLEILLNETKGKDWIFRRDKRITKPISKLFLTTESGIKFLRPEIVLLYKSKNPREKDERDFQTAVEFLDSESKEWLRNSLSVCYSGHDWLKTLQKI
ncbi:MAG TPA: hypothetical protein VK892_17820 [Pyrinomonadaceae bacterium]|nr:hypothetical protein [Pyrinomonadaceae bacterium]